MALQFIVPQFIDVEEKIIGPISVRQFVLMLVGAGLITLDYQLLYKGTGSFVFFVVVAIFVVALIIVFAFLRINGQPFHLFLLNVFISMRNPALRVWNKEVVRETLPHVKVRAVRAVPLRVKQPLTPTKLTQLSLVVDTGGAYKEEENLAFDLDTVNRRESLFTPPR